MATDDQDPTPGTREHFLQMTQLRRWGTIQEYVELCRAQGYCTPAFDATAIAQMERIHVRRRRKQITNAQTSRGSVRMARPRASSCRRSCSAPRSTGRSSPITTAWRGITSSKRRPTATTPRRATASSCRSSARTTRWAARVRLAHPNPATTDAVGEVGASSFLGSTFSSSCAVRVPEAAGVSLRGGEPCPDARASSPGSRR
jgi:hypothetical protein